MLGLTTILSFTARVLSFTILLSPSTLPLSSKPKGSQDSLMCQLTSSIDLVCARTPLHPLPLEIGVQILWKSVGWWRALRTSVEIGIARQCFYTALGGTAAAMGGEVQRIDSLGGIHRFRYWVMRRDSIEWAYCRIVQTGLARMTEFRGIYKVKSMPAILFSTRIQAIRCNSS